MLFALEDVSFYYAAKKVIADFSIALAPGKFYGIIGPNGCGKTTILDLLTKHRQPAAGRIYFRRRSLGSYSSKQLAREIALVPQNFYINFPFTVQEVVMMGRYPHIARFAAPSTADRQIVERVMEKTGIRDFTHRFVTELSGGERQRVIFARALVQNTPVLILDEATSNLDINYALNLLNLSEQGVREEGKTVIAVMQDINLAAAFCDYLIFMAAGRIVAHGSTAQVLNPETVQAVFNVASKVYPEAFSGCRQVVFRKR